MKTQNKEFCLECSSLQQGSQSMLRSTEAALVATGALCKTFHVAFSLEMTIIAAYDVRIIYSCEMLHAVYIH